MIMLVHHVCQITGLWRQKQVQIFDLQKDKHDQNNDQK